MGETVRAPQSPDDLHPRQRLVVLYLWAGLSPKQVASVMGVNRGTVREKMCLIGKRLPGQGSPFQKILLWRSEHVLRQQVGQTSVG